MQTNRHKPIPKEQVLQLPPFEGLRLAGRQVRRPDLTIATEDHNTPTVNIDLPIADITSRTQIDTLRKNAEEFGITQANVDEMVKSANPEIKRLLGAEGKFGESLGLTNDWVVRIVKAVGNYGESFERHLGQQSPLKIARGQNALWSNGGLQYAPPIR